MTNLPTSSALLPISVAAHKLGVSIDTLRYWEKIGRIKSVKLIGGSRYFYTKEINKLKREKHEKNILSQAVSIADAAKYLGVSKDTLRRWDKSGIFKSIKIDTNNRYYLLSHLARYKLQKPLSIKEAAQKIGVSPTTLRRLERRNGMKILRDRNGSRIFSNDDLEKIQSLLSVNSQHCKHVNTNRSSNKDVNFEINSTINNNLIARSGGHNNFNFIFSKIKEINKNILLAGEIIFSLAMISILVLTLAFLIIPEKAAKILGYRYISLENNNTRVLGVANKKDKYQNNKLTKITRPFSSAALALVRFVDEETYRKVIPENTITDINDVFSLDGQGGLIAHYKIKDGNSENENIDAFTLRGLSPGNGAGNIVILDEQGNLSFDGIITSKSVTTNSLVVDAVTSEKIKDKAIKTEDVSDSSINSSLIKDGEVRETDLADNAITTKKIADNSVSSSKLADGSIDETKLQDDSINSTKIQDGGVNASDLAANLGFEEGTFLDLSKITHSTSALQGIRVPNVDSSNLMAPFEGEGYLAWDKTTHSLVVYDGERWKAVDLRDFDLLGKKIENTSD